MFRRIPLVPVIGRAPLWGGKAQGEGQRQRLRDCGKSSHGMARRTPPPSLSRLLLLLWLAAVWPEGVRCAASMSGGPDGGAWLPQAGPALSSTAARRDSARTPLSAGSAFQWAPPRVLGHGAREGLLPRAGITVNRPRHAFRLGVSREASGMPATVLRQANRNLGPGGEGPFKNLEQTLLLVKVCLTA